ncbi:hypothetical protein MC885_012659 [Smutsia gigantea]|nr:hypothetical protein MC885_012659 [Smutsia gigantea]
MNQQDGVIAAAAICFPELSFCANNKNNLRTSSQQGWKGDVLRIRGVAVTVAQVSFTDWAPKNPSALLPKRQVSSLPFRSRSHTVHSRAPGALLDTGKCPEQRSISPLPGKVIEECKKAEELSEEKSQLGSE